MATYLPKAKPFSGTGDGNVTIMTRKPTATAVSCWPLQTQGNKFLDSNIQSAAQDHIHTTNKSNKGPCAAGLVDITD